MSLRREAPGVLRSPAPAERGDLGRALAEFGAELVVGHPTFRNQATIGAELAGGIEAAADVYAGRRVAFVVSDGSERVGEPDPATLDAAEAAAKRSLAGLEPAARGRVLVALLPYDGYDGDRTPGKGSALKLIFEELALCPAARTLVLLDGDLRNDLRPWFEVFRRVEEEHRRERSGEFFLTARYARHFVDASLTRFIVGPLTTLMGRYVPGGISGDIVLSAGAVQRERRAQWDEHRRRYGTDIATTFDAIADPATVIYEAYLGAKLHDITDEAKLSVMPGEVIGAALGRILHYQRLDGRVSRVLESEAPLQRPVAWGPERTGIGFIDPGYTSVFDVDRKRASLVDGFPRYREAIDEVLAPASASWLRESFRRLRDSPAGDEAPLEFLGMDPRRWVQTLHEALAYLLATEALAPVKQALSYLYAAAFLEFCADKIRRLGARTLGEVRLLQRQLGVAGPEAPEFYRREVDDPVEAMAVAFHAGRGRIRERMAALTPRR